MTVATRKVWSKKPGAESKLFAFERNGRVGFIDRNGKIVIDAVISAPIEDVGDFSDGLARVGQQGYIDETGRFAIKQHSFWLFDFSDGFAVAWARDEQTADLGLVLDRTGKIVGRVPASRTGEFSEGLASVEAEGKPAVRQIAPPNMLYRDYPGLKGFLDMNGNIVIKPAFAEVGPFVKGLARAVLDGYCHIATPRGYREGTPTTGYPSSCGGAPADAVTPCKVGFIDQKGAFAIEPRFEAAQDFQEDLAAVLVGSAWGFIDTNGSMVIAPRFEQVQAFSERLAALKMGGKWGYIDKAGRLKVPPQFEEVEPFSDSLAIVYVGRKPIYIDQNGRTKIAGPFREATPFVHGLAAVLLNDKHVAYIDHRGKTVFDYFRR